MKEQKCRIDIDFKWIEDNEGTCDCDKGKENFTLEINIYKEIDEIVRTLYHEFSHFICSKFYKLSAEKEEKLCRQIESYIKKKVSKIPNKEGDKNEKF